METIVEDREGLIAKQKERVRAFVAQHRGNKIRLAKKAGVNEAVLRRADRKGERFNPLSDTLNALVLALDAIEREQLNEVYDPPPP